MIEDTVLASALLNKNDLHSVMELDEECFTGCNVYIFRAMRELYEAGQEISSAVLYSRLLETGRHDESGGVQRIIDILNNGSSVNIGYLIQSLRRKVYVDKIKRMAKEIIDANDCQLDEMLGNFTQEVYTKGSNKSKDITTTEEIMHLDLDEEFKDGDYHPTEIKALDSVISGFFNGQLICLAARPGEGKSALALQIARQMEGDVLMFSLEMRNRENIARLLSSTANIESWKIETKTLDGYEWEKITKSMSQMGSMNIAFCDTAFNIHKILAVAGKFCLQKRPSCIIIDYLQLIDGGKGEDTNNKLGNITRLLKQFAATKNVPILLLSQLTRLNEREKRAPDLFDLRGSGSIEQDCDGVIFIYNAGDRISPAYELIVAKSRKGKCDAVPIIFDKTYVRFLQWEEEKIMDVREWR